MAEPIQNGIIPNYYCFQFRDEREYNNAPNAGCFDRCKKQNNPPDAGCLDRCNNWAKALPVKQPWKGSVIHIPSGDIYGFGHAKDDCTLRTLFFAVAVANPIIVPFRVFFRAAYLFTGYFAKQGYDDALLAWEIKRLECCRANHPEEAPGNAALAVSVSLYVLAYFARELAKCATWVIGAIIVEFGALYGLIRPLDGLRIISLAEHTWSINVSIENQFLIRIVNYQAACMQPKHVALDNALFALRSYDPNTLRSLCHTIEKQRIRYAPYLQGIDFQPFVQFQGEIARFSPSDAQEIGLMGAAQDNEEKAQQTFVRAILLDLVRDINALQQNLNARVAVQLNPQDQELQDALAQMPLGDPRLQMDRLFELAKLIPKVQV